LDRNTITGLVLIFILTIAWAYFTMPSQEEIQRQQELQAQRDSVESAEANGREDRIDEDVEQSDIEDRFQQQITSQREPVTKTAGVFGEASAEDTTFVRIDTPFYEAIFSNVGAGPVKYTLKEYDRWNGLPVQMIRDTTRSAYSLGFLSDQNYNIETDNLVFEQVTGESEIVLNGGENDRLQYKLELEDGSQLIYTYTFTTDKYEIDLDIEFRGLEPYIAGNSVDFGWNSPLNFTERDRTQEALQTAAYVYAGGELEKLMLSEGGTEETRITGTIDWVATRTKFFGQIIKPVTDSNAALLTGEVSGPTDDPTTQYRYESFIQSVIPADGVLSYRLYSGPLRYYDLREFDENAFDMVEISYAWMRFFADPLVKWIIIPFFTAGSTIINNYGILIIIFGFLVKLVLFPLTQKSFKSMAAMKELQPQMKELQEKYKDNPKKQQQETIKLYRKAKVNPLGGCLPMLLQFPILITLWIFFQNSILIRQEQFLWATDLSAPDYILNLPISLPFLGDQLAGFVLLMTASMIGQMKISGGSSMGGGPSPAGAPNMKAFMYIMPLMLLFVFNNFAAGLSLYYLVYNVLSMLQQIIINKGMGGKDNDSEKPGKKKKSLKAG
jgi:YidC/Oxa1 family membrane protein insertase